MSQKVAVFEALFNARYDPATQQITSPLVMLEDVAAAIRTLNASNVIDLSANNPANFIKDFLRSARRNALWPQSILQAGYTARQRTASGQCFEFVPLAPGTLPFPDDFTLSGNEPEFVIQTLSLPLSTRSIVRNDEQSVAQIAVKQHILEHFLASSPKAQGWGISEVTHLQNNVKLRSTEIDALYQVTIISNEDTIIGASSVEVKIGDPIISEQIEKQAIATLTGGSFNFCIPVVIKRFKKGEIVAMHLKLLTSQDIDADGSIDIGDIEYAARYVFKPDLPRI